MTALDDLLARRPAPRRSWFAWTMAAAVAAIAAWAGVAKLDEVSVANGEVVPLGRVKVVQHLEGGIIEEILVAEGDRVAAGQPLLRLDLATTGVNREELRARLDAEELKRARLVAEASAGSMEAPAEAARRHPDIAEAERRKLQARRSELASSRAVLQEQLRQKQLAAQELDARRRAVANNLALARERLRMSEALLAEGLTARMEHVKLQSEVESLEGELASLGPALPRARAAIDEFAQRLIELDTKFRRDAGDDLSGAEEQIARLIELLAQADDQGERAEIRSPIDGVVKKLRTHTVGGVIAAGEPILEIVPSGDKLVVSARLDPADRGYVRVGQPAVVKISAYDFVRYGALDGRVTKVAPDASADPNGRPFFEIMVETETSELGAARAPISAGMQATVDVHTGRRTVLDYLVTPVMKLRAEAFRER